MLPQSAISKQKIQQDFSVEHRLHQNGSTKNPVAVRPFSGGRFPIQRFRCRFSIVELGQCPEFQTFGSREWNQDVVVPSVLFVGVRDDARMSNRQP